MVSYEGGDISKEQYSQSRYDTWKNIVTQKQELMSQYRNIKDTGTYYYKGENNKKIFISGHEVKNRLKSDISLFNKYEVESQKQWQQSLNLPKNINIKKVDDTFYFSSRDTSLDWSKNEFFKIDKAKKINPILGGTAEFGFGAVSSIAAFGKPFVEKASGKKFTHYVSPFDIAFEPLGWSPKGSSEILAKRPLFLAGGIAGEFLQAEALTQMFKGVGIAAKVGVKGVVKKIPKIFVKFTEVFPEEEFLTLSYVKISNKGFSKNIYGWAAKGWKKGREFSFKLSSKVDDVTKIGTSNDVFDFTRSTIKSKYKVDRSLKNPFGKSVWLNSDDIVKYNKMIDESNIIDVNFPRAMSYGKKTRIIGVSDITSLKQSRIFGIKKTYRFNLIDDVIKVKTDPIVKVKSKLPDITKTGYTRNIKVKTDPIVKVKSKLPDITKTGYNLKNEKYVWASYDVGIPKKPVSSSTLRVSGPEWKKITDKLWHDGYFSKFDITESGKVIVSNFVKGSSKYSRPLPKKWIYKIENSFIKSKKATVGLIQKTKPSFYKKPSLSIHGAGTFDTIKIPVYKIDFSFSSFISSKLGNIKIQDYEVKSEYDMAYINLNKIDYMQVSDNAYAQRFDSAQTGLFDYDSDTIKISDSDTINISSFKLKGLQDTKQKLLFVKIPSLTSRTRAPKPKFPVKPNRIKIPFMFMLPINKSKRSKKKISGYDLFGEGYKFREYDIGIGKYKSPFKGGF